MFRKTFTILSLLGLLLSVGLWGVNYYGLTYRRVSSPGYVPPVEVEGPPFEPVEDHWAECRSLMIIVKNNHLYVQHEHETCDDFDTPKEPWVQSQWSWGFGGPRFTGMRKWLPSYYRGRGGADFQTPLHLPVVIFSAYPVYCLLPFHRRRKRKKLGLCVRCGYDLRGSPDRGPECGTEF